jgi:hypothetical protein
LSAQESDGVRSVLAKNPIIPKTIQLIFSHDKSVLVRRLLAANPALDLDVQVILSKDKEDGVKSNLARNLRDHTPISQKQKTDLEYSEIIRDGAEENLIKLALDNNTPPQIIENICEQCHPKYDEWVSVALALNRNVPPDRLNDISRSKNTDVLEAVASNPSVSLNILSNLSKNKNSGVRTIVANPAYYVIPPFMIP